MDHYQALVDLDQKEIVSNAAAFDCPVCFETFEAGEGIVLRECLHTFCRPCIRGVIKFSQEVVIRCPYQDSQYSCESVLQQREIKGLVSNEDFEKHLAKSVRQAEFVIGNTFHCQTPNCVGWWTFDTNANFYKCPICGAVNCTDCKVIHEGLECEVYKALNDFNNTVQLSINTLEQMIVKREAMECSTCGVVVEKIDGCQGITCTLCNTALCWATRGPRWGPNGKGDISGGCRCGVGGKRCHPSCRNCH